MFLYFKRREKRRKREAPRPRFLVLRRKTLTVGAALLAAAAIFGAVNAPAAVRASVATRQLPIYCVERDQKVCSISFDAAWGADNTQKILDVLADYGVKATFFVVGNWADQYPEQAKAIVDSGCELMNHSNRHCLTDTAHLPQIKAEQTLSTVFSLCRHGKLKPHLKSTPDCVIFNKQFCRMRQRGWFVNNANVSESKSIRKGGTRTQRRAPVGLCGGGAFR